MNQNPGPGRGRGKRPLDGSTNLTGREKKRAKNQVARNIQIQSIGTPSHVDPSNPDNNRAEGDSTQVLVPGTVDAVNFAEARAFEINAMHTAIKNASFSLNQLSFQSLPRGLRRRAASHNVKRLPLRLREQAKKEVGHDDIEFMARFCN